MGSYQIFHKLHKIHKLLTETVKEDKKLRKDRYGVTIMGRPLRFTQLPAPPTQLRLRKKAHWTENVRFRCL